MHRHAGVTRIELKQVLALEESLVRLDDVASETLDPASLRRIAEDAKLLMFNREDAWFAFRGELEAAIAAYIKVSREQVLHALCIKESDASYLEALDLLPKMGPGDAISWADVGAIHQHWMQAPLLVFEDTVNELMGRFSLATLRDLQEMLYELKGHRLCARGDRWFIAMDAMAALMEEFAQPPDSLQTAKIVKKVRRESDSTCCSWSQAMESAKKAIAAIQVTQPAAADDFFTQSCH